MATTNSTQSFQTNPSAQFDQTEYDQNEQPSTSQTVDYYYTNFQGSHIRDASDPKEKSMQNGKINYKEIPLQYNYGTPEHPIIDACFFEFPEVSSYGGIVCKKEDPKPSAKEGDPPYIKESYAIMFTFNLQDAESVACLQKLDDMHKGTCQVLAKHKGKVGMYSFNPEHPGEIYKHPIYYKIDPVSCERVVGRNPTIWVKLNVWKNNKTLFTDVNGNPIDWTLLSDVEVKMIPLIHVEKIYIGGGKASLQLKLHSAIVTDIVPINTRSRQTTTLDRLKNKKGLADSVSSQLAQMRMERQDAIDGGHIRPTTAKLPGVDAGTMHQISSSTGFQGTQENLAAYLGGAPAMNNPSQQFIQTQPQLNQSTQPQQIQLPVSVPTQINIQPGINTQPPKQVQQSMQAVGQSQSVQFVPQKQVSHPVLQIQ